MTLAAQGLRLTRGVKWRSFTDGFVVYVAETCETHLLPPDFIDLLEVSAPGINPGDAHQTDTSNSFDACRRVMTGVSEAQVRELVDLKIFESVN
jgi:hypothetical protein